MQNIEKKVHGATIGGTEFIVIPKSPSRPISHEETEEGSFELSSEDTTDSNQHLFENLPDYYRDNPTLHANPYTLLEAEAWQKPNNISPIQSTFRRGIQRERIYPEPVIRQGGIEVWAEPVYQTPPIQSYELLHLGILPSEPHIKPEVLKANSTLLIEMLSEIDSLLENEYNWDEIDYKNPTLEDMKSAKITLTKFVNVITYSGHLLTEPDIFNSEDGGATIEWHSNNRSLYLRMDSSKSVATQIEDQSNGTTIVDIPFEQKSYLSLWKWLINE